MDHVWAGGLGSIALLEEGACHGIYCAMEKSHHDASDYGQRRTELGNTTYLRSIVSVYLSQLTIPRHKNRLTSTLGNLS